jgi:hypothetical protein
MDKLLRAWERPQLIVLAKSTPEESVLTHCKTMNPNQAVIGPNIETYQLTCAAGTVNKCDNCQSRAVNAS